MTREEIISAWEFVEDGLPFDALESKDNRVDMHELIHYTIQALSAEPCEDCISRQAMHIEFEKWITYGEYKYSNATKYLYDRIDRLPSVTPKQKMGRWIMPQQDDGTSDPIYYQVRCSECNFDLDPQTWHQELNQYGADKFCPNCGAKMESEDQK